MKESDCKVLQKEEKLAATLIELDKSDTHLRNCREEVDNLRRNSVDANNHEIKGLNHQLGLAEQVNRDTAMALENQSIILKKTELALDSTTELINAENKIIENLKIVVYQFKKNAPRPNKHNPDIRSWYYQ